MLTLAANLLVARMHGAAGAGLLYLAISAVSIGGVIALVGVSQPVMRHVAVHAFNSRTDVRCIMRGGLLLVIAASVAVVPGTLVILYLFLPRSEFRMIWLACLAVPAWALTQLYAGGLTGLGYPLRGELGSRVAVQLCLLCAVAGLSWSGTSLMWPSIVLCAAYAVPMAYLLFEWRLRLGYEPPSARRRPAESSPWTGRLLAEGAPLLLASSLSMFPQWLDVFIVNHYVGVREAGVYATSVRVAAVIGLVAVGPQALASPRFARLYASGQMSALRSLAHRVNLWLGVLSICGFVVVLAAGPTLLRIFGASFSAGWEVLLVASAAQVIHASFGLVLVLLVMTGQGRRALIASGCSLVADVGLNLALVPRLGITGSALGSAAAAAVLNIVAALFVWKSLGISPVSIRRREA